jgi:transposase-like protein
MATDWNKIKAEYIQGGISYRKLAQKYGVSFSSISRRMRDEKWTDLREQSEIKANAKIVQSVADKKAKRVDKIEQAADLLLDMIVQGIRDGSLNLTTKNSMCDITGALRDIREIKGMKSDLDIQEQKARIEKLRREAREEEQSKDIRVVIGSELEDYSK